MVRKLTHGCLAMLLVLLAGADAAAQAPRNFCRYVGMRYCDGCVVTRRIVTRVGSTCVFRRNSGGGMLFDDEILTRPTLGSFGRASQWQSAYRAGATAGADFFVYRVRWEKLGRVNSAVVNNHVLIRPLP